MRYTQTEHIRADDVINAWLRDLDQRSERIEPIHHYAPSATLPLILESRTLWATRSDKQSDPDDHGIYLPALIALMKRIHARANVFTAEPGLPVEVLTFFQRDGYGLKEVEKKQQEMLTRMSDLRAQTFTTSFCVDGDLPYLWDRYASAGNGFSLAFAPRPTPPLPARNVFRLRKARYLSPDAIDAELEARIREMRLGLPWDLMSHLETIRRRYLENFAVWESPCIKATTFEKEQEYRWVLRVEGSDEAQLISSVGGTRMHYPIPFDVVDLKGVVVGPSLDFNHEKREVERLLRDHGFDLAQVPITQSIVGRS